MKIVDDKICTDNDVKMVQDICKNTVKNIELCKPEVARAILENDMDALVDAIGFRAYLDLDSYLRKADFTAIECGIVNVIFGNCAKNPETGYFIIDSGDYCLEHRPDGKVEKRTEKKEYHCYGTTLYRASLPFSNLEKIWNTLNNYRKNVEKIDIEEMKWAADDVARGFENIAYIAGEYTPSCQFLLENPDSETLCVENIKIGAQYVFGMDKKNRKEFFNAYWKLMENIRRAERAIDAKEAKYLKEIYGDLKDALKNVKDYQNGIQHQWYGGIPYEEQIKKEEQAQLEKMRKRHELRILQNGVDKAKSAIKDCNLFEGAQDELANGWYWAIKQRNQNNGKYGKGKAVDKYLQMDEIEEDASRMYEYGQWRIENAKIYTDEERKSRDPKTDFLGWTVDDLRKMKKYIEIVLSELLAINTNESEFLYKILMDFETNSLKKVIERW